MGDVTNTAAGLAYLKVELGWPWKALLKTSFAPVPAQQTCRILRVWHDKCLWHMLGRHSNTVVRVTFKAFPITETNIYCMHVPQINDWYRGPTELLQHFVYRGSAHQRKGALRHVIDMVWRYQLPHAWHIPSITWYTNLDCMTLRRL